MVVVVVVVLVVVILVVMVVVVVMVVMVLMVMVVVLVVVMLVVMVVLVMVVMVVVVVVVMVVVENQLREEDRPNVVAQAGVPAGRRVKGSRPARQEPLSPSVHRSHSIALTLLPSEVSKPGSPQPSPHQIVCLSFVTASTADLVVMAEVAFPLLSSLLSSGYFPPG
jgi:hypothetical protein